MRDRIEFLFKRLCVAHPRLGPDAANPVNETRDKSEILFDVLFPDQPHRDDAASRDGNRNSVETLQHYYAFAMMAERAMTKIGGDHFTVDIKPLM